MAAAGHIEKCVTVIAGNNKLKTQLLHIVFMYFGMIKLIFGIKLQFWVQNQDVCWPVYWILREWEQTIWCLNYKIDNQTCVPIVYVIWRIKENNFGKNSRFWTSKTAVTGHIKIRRNVVKGIIMLDMLIWYMISTWFGITELIFAIKFQFWDQIHVGFRLPFWIIMNIKDTFSRIFT